MGQVLLRWKYTCIHKKAWKVNMINLKILQDLKNSKKKVLVIGDVMIDEYYVGDIKRISPEFPVPVFNFISSKSVLGGAANVAANLRAINITTGLMTVIGNDELGKNLIEKCENLSISTEMIFKDNDRTTTLKTRLLNQNNAQVIRLDKESTGSISQDMEQRLVKAFESTVSAYDVILISDYNKGLLTEGLTRKIIDVSNKNAKKVIIDVKDKNVKKYSYSYLLKPNLKELQMLTGMRAKTDEEILNACKAMVSLCSVAAILVTLGSEGMLYYDINRSFKISTAAKEVFDVTGAGDTVLAYIGAAIANGIEMEHAVEIANLAAGIKVGKSGTSAVSIEDLIAEIMSNKKCVLSYEEKIINQKGLDKLKKAGKIVFTNGCFDILHFGHVSYLQEAKRLGDTLIVGVNSDESIKRLKGIDRPIVPLKERMGMLASLECVDFVISFEQDTPLELIKEICPQVLVKGADYKEKEIVGSDFVIANGGSVELINFIKGISTTNIIDKIVKTYSKEAKN